MYKNFNQFRRGPQLPHHHVVCKVVVVSALFGKQCHSNVGVTPYPPRGFPRVPLRRNATKERRAAHKRGPVLQGKETLGM